jgi:hypothetical protein
VERKTAAPAANQILVKRGWLIILFVYIDLPQDIVINSTFGVYENWNGVKTGGPPWRSRPFLRGFGCWSNASIFADGAGSRGLSRMIPNSHRAPVRGA